MLRFKTPELARSAARLGFTDQALQQCLNVPAMAEAERRIAALRKSIQRAFRKLALELHPDRHPGDAEKAEEFVGLSAAYNEIEAFLSRAKVQPRPQQPRPAFVRVVTWQSTSSTTSTSTNGGTWSWGSNW